MPITGCHADYRLASGAGADRVVVMKKERTLLLLDHGAVLKKYRVALGGEPVGPKRKSGDHKTPEGIYVLDRPKRTQPLLPLPAHFLSQHGGSRARGEVRSDPGGDVMIHGLPNGLGWMGSTHRLRDWTDGCIAVTDEEMDEIWQAVPDGTVIEINP